MMLVSGAELLQASIIARAVWLVLIQHVIIAEKLSLSSKDQTYATNYLEAVAPKNHRHNRPKYRANNARARTAPVSGKVYGGATWKSLCVSYFSLYYPLTPQQHAEDEAYSRIEFSDANKERVCGLSWPLLNAIDVQALNVLNQSPGGQRPFFSRDLSTNALAKDWDFCKRDNLFSTSQWPASLAILSEPALGLTASIHVRDPGDITNSPARSRDLTIHPLLSAQVDLVNLSFEKTEYPWPEFKLTTAPQLDLYGPFTGKDAQVQMPLQPNLEWHLSESWSAVFQVSIPLFTVGGRNPPPSFAVGMLWHAKTPEKLPSCP